MEVNTSNFIDSKKVTLTGERIKEICREVGELYLSDARPWVIGYSGGKDSTAVLQLVWQAVKSLPAGKATKPVFVIASDTLVETPVIVGHLNKTLAKMNDAAVEHGLPFSAHKVTPEVNDTFWSNLIGRGYPAPYNRFRWCTDRMKIKPATRFIYDRIGDFGEVILALGARKSESATRAQVMKNRRKAGNQLSRHCDIPGAWVYTPIEDWQTEDVWTYLLNVPSPWGGRNRDLVTMYRNAQAGECPLVVDTSTPSCGNSRFGCWTCTVVQQDKSMEAMIDAGEDWLEPMLELRDYLASTQDPARKAELRDLRGRNGKYRYRTTDEGDKVPIPGPYYMHVRQDILRRLLEAEQEVRRRSGDDSIELITRDELVHIRQLWRFEEGDWEDSLPKIYQETAGGDLDWLHDDWSGMGAAEKEILSEVTVKHGLAAGLIAELFDAEREQHGMRRRSQIHSRIESVLSKDWRDPEPRVSLKVTQ